MKTDVRPDPAEVHSEYPPILCVDLDGSLVATDTLWESLLILARTDFWALFLLPAWLVQGRAHLKQEVGKRVSLRPELLPYRSDVIDYLREQRSFGRKIVLITAADESIACSVSQFLEIFDEVLASDGRNNLKGPAKTQALVERFGAGGFSYLGDSAADEAVWQQAGAALTVGRRHPASAAIPIEKKFAARRASISDYIRALRIHHWAKNVLLLLPLLLAHRFTVARVSQILLATILFGLAASSIYVFNDLLDLQSDRKHPWKARRPLASGRIPIPTGIVLFAVSFLLFLVCGELAVGWRFVGLTLAYCVLSLAYSLRLKRIVLLDVFILSSFYGIRLFIGAVVTNVPLSHWFLAFSGFFFFSLAMAKRYSELLHAGELVETKNSGRNYRLDDRPLLSMFGIGSAFAAVVILALYIQSPDVLLLYPRPFSLLALCPLLLYWVCRIWLIAHRGKLRDDPVVMAARDPISYAILACALLSIAISFRMK